MRTKKLKRARQLELPMRTWGGKRKNAGRKPKGDRAGVPHLKRQMFARRFPVHVTVRMEPEVWSLRSRRSFRVVGKAIWAATERFGARLCGFSVQGNHIHLVVEAESQEALSRGMQGLGIRVAKGLNRLMNRRGRVLADRYHTHVLRTPSEVRHAVHYVAGNHQKHVAERGGRLGASYVDPYSSAGCHQLEWWEQEGHPPLVVARPRTWLLGQVVH